MIYDMIKNHNIHYSYCALHDIHLLTPQDASDATMQVLEEVANDLLRDYYQRGERLLWLVDGRVMQPVIGAYTLKMMRNLSRNHAKRNHRLAIVHQGGAWVKTVMLFVETLSYRNERVGFFDSDEYEQGLLWLQGERLQPRLSDPQSDKR